MSWQSILKKVNARVADQFQRPVFLAKEVDWSRLVVIDFETYYDQDYTLSKLSTSEYVRDPRFKAQMMYLKVGLKPARIIPPNKIRAELRKINWGTHGLLAHHTQFDGLILSHHYGVVPSFYYDTLSMARGIHSNEIGAGLDEVSMYYGGKGKIHDVLEKTKGVRDWSPALYAEVSTYCLNDGDETLRVFTEMLYALPSEEIDLIDVLVRMFCEPLLRVNVPRVEAELARELAEREKLFLSVLDPKPFYEDKTVLKTKAERALEGKERDILVVKRIVGSTNRFADLLIAEGVDPPVKLSPAWMKKDKAAREADEDGKWAYAFAKDDVEFINLPDDTKRWTSIPDVNTTEGIKEMAAKSERLRLLVDTRIAVKSTTNITRAERLLTSAKHGTLPAYYAYSRAHTHRLGGGDKRNLQNLKRGGALRESIEAPPGYELAVGDSGQIEARVNAWLWGQHDILAAFKASDAKTGADPYCLMATLIYGRTITKDHKMERFVGKVCVASDTLVLTNHGPKSIVEVRSNDLLWDGTAWVRHDGLIHQGKKEVLRYQGLAATADHEILTEHGWQEWSAVLTAPSRFQSALASATLPSYGGTTTPPRTENLGAIGQYVAALVALKTWFTSAASKMVAALAATLAQKSPRQLNVIGLTRTPYPTTNTALAYSTGSLPQSGAAQIQATKVSNTTDFAASLFQNSGEETEPLFWSMFKPCLAGTIRLWKWIAATTTVTMNRAISSFARVLPTCSIGDAWKTSNNASAISKETTQTYDLANAGPNHRFTVLTEAGPLIVHNCVLGLGFQMGAPKLQITLAKGALGGPPIFITLEEAKRWVQTYRRKNDKIAKGWDICNGIIEDMAAGREGSHGPLNWEKDCIWLPNGMRLHYPDLKKAIGDQGWDEWTYASTLKGQPIRKKIYGGLLCENIVQALARIIVMYQMLDLSKTMRMVMTTHDEMVACVKKVQASSASARMLKRMTVPLDWCKDLPLSSEGGHAFNYSK